MLMTIGLFKQTLNNVSFIEFEINLSFFFVLMLATERRTDYSPSRILCQIYAYESDGTAVPHVIACVLISNSSRITLRYA